MLRTAKKEGIKVNPKAYTTTDMGLGRHASS